MNGVFSHAAKISIDGSCFGLFFPGDAPIRLESNHEGEGRDILPKSGQRSFRLPR